MSFPRYPVYKDSGVDWLGDVPAHWAVSKFRHCFRESSEKIENKVIGPMLSVSGYRGIEIKEYDDENRKRSDEDLVGYRIVRPRQLVVNTMWLNYAGLGVSEYEGHVSPAYRSYWIREELSKRFVHHLMRSETYVKGYTKFLTGIRPNSLQMSREDLMVFPLLVPSVVEQEAIAQFLDSETSKVDGLIAEQEKLIALLKEKRQAVISHAVTKGLDPNAPMKDSGIEWLGEVPAHWRRAEKLTAIADRGRHSFVNGPFGSDLLASELREEGVPVIYIRDIKPCRYVRVSEVCVTPGKAEQIAFCNAMPGDVLVAKVGDPPGVAAVYPEEEPLGVVTQDVIRLRVDPQIADSRFVAFLLNSDFGRVSIDQISVESTRTRVGLGDYKQMKVVLPPLCEQRTLVAHLERALLGIELLMADSIRGIELLKEHRSSLISAAVTGKIDVRQLAAAEAA